MYRITVSASRLTAYSSESGSFSETRQNTVSLVPERRPGQMLGQECGDPGRSVGGGQADHVGHTTMLVHLVHLVHAIGHLFHLVD